MLPMLNKIVHVKLTSGNHDITNQLIVGENSVLKKMLLQQFTLPIHSPPHSRPVPDTNSAAMARRYKLNTGAEIPAIGFGTWQDEAAQEEAVTEAIKAGYRHIDTARV